MTTTLITLGLLVSLLGLAGCILPILPGPPISFLALILLSWVKDWEPFGVFFLVISGALMALVTLLDVIAPGRYAKKYGASKLGMWGSITGLIVGVFFFPPWGMVIGAFVGALAGELVARKGGRSALRAGWGAFVGLMVSTGLKVAYSGSMLFFYIKEMF